MITNITAIRTNGSSISQQFNNPTEAVKEVFRWWDDENTYGGIIRVFVNVGNVTEEFNPTDLFDRFPSGHWPTTNKVKRPVKSWLSSRSPIVPFKGSRLGLSRAKQMDPQTRAVFEAQGIRFSMPESPTRRTLKVIESWTVTR